MTSTYQKGLFNPVGARLVKYTQTYPDAGVPLSETQIDATGGSLIAIQIDNSANGTTNAYLKLWIGSAPTPDIGDEPKYVFKAPPGTNLQYTFNPPISFGAAATHAVFTTEAKTAARTSPAGNTTAHIMYGV